MKVYLSADMEGITGVSTWDEVDRTKSDYPPMLDQLTREVVAASEAAVGVGATELYVKDAHWTARNLPPARLPECARISRGWSGHPFMMMDELDASFAAAMVVGYHSRVASGTHPLAHTLNATTVHALLLNGRPLSEYYISALTAAYVGVPLTFVCGDEGLCAEVQEVHPQVVTVGTSRGRGASTISLHPAVAERRIREGVALALSEERRQRCLLTLPERFKVELELREATVAYAKSFYPGAKLVGPRHLTFETRDFFEVLRFFHFVI